MSGPSEVDLDEIQGNVTPGFRKDWQELIFFRFPADPTRASDWVTELQPDIATAHEVAVFNRRYRRLKQRHGDAVTHLATSTWVNVAFTAEGLTKLLPQEDVNTFPCAFARGMSRRSQEVLRDDRKQMKKWNVRDWAAPDAPEQEQVAHALLIVGADTDDALRHEVDSQVSRAKLFGLTVRAQFRGRTLGHGKEHFGFKDSISQPDPPDPLDGWNPDGERIVAPGEFIRGYTVEPELDGSDPDGAEEGTPDWERNGSYLVFRRYRQLVNEFNDALDANLGALHQKLGQCIPRELLAAKLMGRWQSGAKLKKWEFGGQNETRDPAESDPKPPGYSTVTGDDFTRDKLGDGCPLFAHIRKAHPRGSEHEPRKHRIIRRGITYDDGEDGRGLLFLAYQARIEKGFEHIQSAWFNDTTFPSPSSWPTHPDDPPKIPPEAEEPGLDPIVGQGGSRHLIDYHVGPQEQFQEVKLAAFVKVEGGAYLFSPSIQGLDRMGGR